MNIFRDPLDSITSSDIEQVCSDEVSEGLQSVGAEFALAPGICVIGSEAILAEYGVQNFRDACGTRLPVGFHKFPTLSVGRPDDFLNLIARFDEDVWNLAGVDIRNV
jgi:hypothetical protein